MSTPLLVEVRRLWPAAHVTLLGKAANCELLRASPMLDAVYEAPVVPFALRNRSGMEHLRRWLAQEHFDLAIIALGDDYAAVLADAGIPVRIGVAGHPLEPCLTHPYEIGHPRTWGPNERLNALRSLGCTVREASPALWVDGSASAVAVEKLASLGLRPGERYVALHPFGSTPYQWWQIDKVSELAASVHNTTGLRSVIIGGPEVRGRMSTQHSPALVDATGHLSIPELLAVISGADLLVSTDSGPFHIAGALGRPLVGVFRGRRPEHAHRYPVARTLLGSHPQCAKQCRWNRCVTAPCRELASITVPQVADTVREMLTTEMVTTEMLTAERSSGTPCGGAAN